MKGRIDRLANNWTTDMGSFLTSLLEFVQGLHNLFQSFSSTEDFEERKSNESEDSAASKDATRNIQQGLPVVNQPMVPAQTKYKQGAQQITHAIQTQGCCSRCIPC